ncbi:hypothetical protein LPTSP4_01270 [Leptospira ryugenii]|uniref:Flagellar hook-length control protein-like C-terminal domain-containing protein n=1 Tax=Leptospira ryugenii TaxID=1917863 RepID=A0A2P2DVK2_9LEPT|nr:flagellar hook-length control protein FliK [Leptospira ryugenii]GBF48627.1 hypothetical protein LPTSP4_01270 [Leptospira ryugenii]
MNVNKDKISFPQFSLVESKVANQLTNNPAEATNKSFFDILQSSHLADVPNKLQEKGFFETESKHQTIPDEKIESQASEERVENDFEMIDAEESSDERDIDQSSSVPKIDLSNNISYFEFALQKQHKDSHSKESEDSLPKGKLFHAKLIEYPVSNKEQNNFVEEAKKMVDRFLKKETPRPSAQSNQPKLEVRETISKETLAKSAPKEIGLEKIQNEPKVIPFPIVSKTENVSRKKDIQNDTKPSLIHQSKELPKADTEPKDINAPKLRNENKEALEAERKISIRKRGNAQNSEDRITEKDSVENKSESLGLSLRTKTVREKDQYRLKPEGVVQQEGSKNQRESIGISLSQVSQTMGKEESSNQNGQGSTFSQREQNSFAQELKQLTKQSDSTKPENVKTPSRPELQRNLEDLVKQAKFDIVQNGKSTAEIVMNPREYGRLTLKVSVEGDQVEGRILVETEELKQMLNSEISKLKENLKENGLQLGSLLVDVWEDSSSRFSGGKQSKDFQEYKDMLESAAYRTSSPENSDTILLNETKIQKGYEFFA